MRPILTDRVAWSVGLSVTLVSPAKTAAFWVEDLGGPGEPCIRWGPDPPMGRGKFVGDNGHPIVKCGDTLRSSVQRRLNR